MSDKQGLRFFFLTKAGFGRSLELPNLENFKKSNGAPLS